MKKTDECFNNLVANIEPLESLEAPGWDFSIGFAVGAAGAGIVVGVAIT